MAMKVGSLNRREALALISVSVAGGQLISQQSFAQAAGADGQLLIPGAEVCVITPETTEGPFYFDPALERADIREGKPGVPTRVRLQVVDAGCTPVAGARVDIWHCDADGQYSGYPGQGDDGRSDTSGDTFLRGSQVADTFGMVEFLTIYPGWYPGRTPHIHFKVLVGQRDLLTGQIFFPDQTSAAIYSSVAAYGGRDAGGQTTNTEDGIARRAGEGAFARVEPVADSYLASMIIGVGKRG